MVAYDYQGHTSIPVPADWRQKIAAFEGWTRLTIRRTSFAIYLFLIQVPHDLTQH